MKVISVTIEGAILHPDKPDPRLKKHNKLVMKYQKKADDLMEKNGFTRKGVNRVAYTRKGGPTVIVRGNLEPLNTKGFGTSMLNKNLPVRLYIGWYGTSTTTRERGIEGTDFTDFWKAQVPPFNGKEPATINGYTEPLYVNLDKDFASGKTEAVLKKQFEALKTFVEGLKKKS